MAVFTDLEKKVRRKIMDQVVADGTCPETEEIMRDFDLKKQELAQVLKNLEAGIVLALQNSSHARASQFQGEPLKDSLPALGEIFYARPFAAFANQHPITVDGKQKWFAECAVEACGLSAMFPGKTVVVNSLCRLTKEPVEIVGRDGVILEYFPKKLCVHLGFPFAQFPEDMVGWCDFNSFFSSREAAMHWRKSHPEVANGMIQDPITTSHFIREIIGKGRLEEDYHPTVPLGRALLSGGKYGFYKKWKNITLPIPEPFWLPNLAMFRAMKKNGYKNYMHFGLV